MNLTSILGAVLVVGSLIFVGVQVNNRLLASGGGVPNITVVVPSGGPATVTPLTASAPAPSATEARELKITKGRTVIISGEVGDASRSQARRILELARESTDPIYIMLNSPGGSVFDGVQVIQAIEASRAPVYTVCAGICASMAAIIFEYGTKRFIANKSILMFHPASGGAQGEIDKMVSRLTFIQSYIGEMEANIARRSGMAFKDYKFLSGVELWTAQSAVKQGLADAVVLLSDPDTFSEELDFSGPSNKRKGERNNALPGGVKVTW